MERYMWIVIVLAGAAITWAFGTNGFSWTEILMLIGIALIAWWVSPLSYGISKKHRDIVALPEDERRVVVYWRPGCIFCQRLRGGLGKDVDNVKWVNIWQDAEAAKFVRSHNNGNETVPTVVIDGEVHTNPDPRVVRDALNA